MLEPETLDLTSLALTYLVPGVRVLKTEALPNDGERYDGGHAALHDRGKRDCIQESDREGSGGQGGPCLA